MILYNNVKRKKSLLPSDITNVVVREVCSRKIDGLRKHTDPVWVFKSSPVSKRIANQKLNYILPLHNS